MSVVFTSTDANALCGNCGHELDKHGVYQGMPEEPCRWNTVEGHCECVDFVFAAPNAERNPKPWKKCTCTGTDGIHSARCPQVAHCIRGVEEVSSFTQSDWERIARMTDDPQWQQTQATLYFQKAAAAAEQKAIDEYRTSSDSLNLLRENIRSIIACAASSAIDHAPPKRPIVSEPNDWLENMSRTASRLHSDMLFSRMVNMMTAEVVREVERYRKSTIGTEAP